MQGSGLSAGTAHHVHRTARETLNEAVRRGHLVSNPALLAKAPAVSTEEIESYEVPETADHPTATWVPAPAKNPQWTYATAEWTDSWAAKVAIAGVGSVTDGPLATVAFVSMECFVAQ